VTAAAHPGVPRPRETVERCALRAQLRGDPMLGTAFPAARLLLVEQPGPWGRRALVDSRFDRGTALALEQRTTAAGIRIQAVRRPGRDPGRRQRRWALADTRSGTETVRWGTFTRDEELLELPLDGTAGDARDEIVYLVCTHGKHDVCCALRGRPVATALNDAAPDQVLETSHLGGDRFGANVLVLPTGLLYGRVLPFAATEFVAAAEADEVVGALLRGRIGTPPAGQAALAFAHEQLALPRRTDVEVLSVGTFRDGLALVRVRTPHGELDVTVAAERVAVDGLTCSNSSPGTYWRYLPVRIDPADASPVV
jgi:Sucrase/ferredoxin-like